MSQAVGRPTALAATTAIGLPLMLIAAILFPAQASAADPPPVHLKITPVGQPAKGFDLTMNPGDKRDLAVQLVNSGSEQIAARTFAANVLTNANGGLGASLVGVAPTGATLWLSYPSQLSDLKPKTPVNKSLTVSVPKGTAPGQYTSALILQNEDAVAGTGAVQINQIIRQLISVAITVPGPFSPALAIGSASHADVGGHSVVSVVVKNTGTQILTPVADMALHDPKGAELKGTSVSMMSFYSLTDTIVEMNLDSLLTPGMYTIDITLTDQKTGTSAHATGLPFTVIAGESALPDPGSTQTQALMSAEATLPIWAIMAGAAMLVLILILVFALLRHRSNGGN